MTSKCSKLIGTTLLRLVVSFLSFEHFDVISMVDMSTDHGKLLSIFFLTITLTVFVVHFR